MKRRPNQMASTCAAVILEDGRGQPEPSPVRALHAQRADGGAHRGHAAGRLRLQPADGQHVAPVEVVVRERGQQVAHGGDAQTTAVSSQGRGTRQAGTLDERVQPARRGGSRVLHPALRGRARGRRRHRLLDRYQQVIVTLSAGHHLHLDVPALGRDGLGQRIDTHRGQSRAVVAGHQLDVVELRQRRAGWPPRRTSRTPAAAGRRRGPGPGPSGPTDRRRPSHGRP